MSDCTNYHLPQIPYLQLRFKLSAQKQAHLPRFKGSLLRGAFGHALRRMVCVMGPGELCENCMLRGQCIFPRLFETFIEGKPPPFLQGLKTAPRPFVIDACDYRQLFHVKESLQFDLLLFGQAIEMLPYAIYAVSKMAENGLGKSRYPFKLNEVFWHNSGSESNPRNNGTWHSLYDGTSKRLTDNPEPRMAGSPNGHGAHNLGTAQNCCIKFLTPARLKFKNNLSSDFTFRMLVFKMLRRVLEIAHFHVPDAQIDWEFKPLLVAADDVRIVRRDLHWQDWQRRSNRQDTTMKMGGFVGKLSLEGNLAPFTDLLRVCEVVHVGKGAVFGNGKIWID